MFARLFLLYSLCFGAAFVFMVVTSMEVKNISSQVRDSYVKIEKLRIENRRLRIEEAVRTNPLETLDFVEERGLKSVPLNKIINIEK